MNIYIQMQISIFKVENIGCILRWRHLTTVLSLPSQKGSNQCVFIKKTVDIKYRNDLRGPKSINMYRMVSNNHLLHVRYFRKKILFRKLQTCFKWLQHMHRIYRSLSEQGTVKKSPYTCNHKKSLSDRDRTKI